MQFPIDQVEELGEICSGTQQHEEAGVPYFFLPVLGLPDGCSPGRVDALLCPTALHGYNSRLFFAQRLTSPQPRNWNFEARILERMWHAISWGIPETNLRLAQVLALHLRAFR